MKKIGTCIYLDPELIEWVKIEAKRRFCSMAQVIRTALVEMKNRTEQKAGE